MFGVTLRRSGSAFASRAKLPASPANRTMSFTDRSWRFISRPAVVPSPGISGRLKANARASCKRNRYPFTAPSTALSWSCRADRSSQGFKATKIVAAFVWFAFWMKFSPTNATECRIAGCRFRKAWMSCTTASVRWRDAASGSSTKIAK